MVCNVRVWNSAVRIKQAFTIDKIQSWTNSGRMPRCRLLYVHFKQSSPYFVLRVLRISGTIGVRIIPVGTSDALHRVLHSINPHHPGASTARGQYNLFTPKFLGDNVSLEAKSRYLDAYTRWQHVCAINVRWRSILALSISNVFWNDFLRWRHVQRWNGSHSRRAFNNYLMMQPYGW